METSIATMCIFFKQKPPLRNFLGITDTRTLSYSLGKERDSEKRIILNLYMTARNWNWKHAVLGSFVCKWCHCQTVSCSGFWNSFQSPYETSLSLFLFLGPVWILNSKQSLWLFSFLNLDFCITTRSVVPDLSLLCLPVNMAFQFSQGIAQVKTCTLASLRASLAPFPQLI